nr:MAG TPA: SprT-like family protein [Caudoviricetes sp.]
MHGDTTVELVPALGRGIAGVTESLHTDNSVSAVHIAYDVNVDEFEFMHTIVHEAIHVVTLRYL